MILGENKEAQLNLNAEQILVIRDGALGDVILTTPVVRRLRETRPAASITICTWYPEVYARNPAVSRIVLPHQLEHGQVFNAVYDLNLVYERSPSEHIVHAYMRAVFGDDGSEWDLQQKLYTSTVKVQYVSHDRYVVVHTAQAGWANRTLPSTTWIRLCELLKMHDYQPIMVGSMRDNMLDRTTPTFYVPDIHAHMQFYQSAAAFIGSDSALLHVAGATNVPIVGVFTSVKPQYRLPIRHGMMGWQCEAVLPNLPCVGCHERQPAPTITESCERGDIACVRAVSARDIFDGFRRLMG